MTADSKAYKVMTDYNVDVNKVTQNYEGTTYHGYGKVDDRQIDFCFVSKAVKPVKYQVIDDKIDNKYPSDHYGLLIDLNFDN